MGAAPEVGDARRHPGAGGDDERVADADEHPSCLLMPLAPAPS
ncbi:hypothetical protein [Lentzea sp. NPDC004782]